MSLKEVKTIGAIGAGAMGSCTALCFALKGYPVKLYDITDAALAAGIKNIQAALVSYVEHGLLKETEISIIMSRIQTTTDLKEAAKEADFVIESIIEHLPTKQKVFSELETICGPQTIFATNTSGLSPTAIASSLKHPGRFVVTHFWNPPHLIPLVEVVPGEKTDPKTVDIAYDLMKKIDKAPVKLKKEALGFIGNRIQAAALREAIHIVEAGIASAEDVDLVVEQSLGRRYAATGPLKSADLGGLDIFKNIFSYIAADLGNTTEIPALLKQTVESGKLGAKTGEGFYPWPEDRLSEAKARRVAELFRHLAQDRDEKEATPKKRFG